MLHLWETIFFLQKEIQNHFSSIVLNFFFAINPLVPSVHKWVRIDKIYILK